MRFRLCGTSYSEAFHTCFLLFPQCACLMGRAGDETLLLTDDDTQPSSGLGGTTSTH